MSLFQMHDASCGWMEGQLGGRTLVEEGWTQHIDCAELSERKLFFVECSAHGADDDFCHAGHIVNQACNLLFQHVFLGGKNYGVLVFEAEVIGFARQVVSIDKAQLSGESEKHVLFNVFCWQEGVGLIGDGGV